MNKGLIICIFIIMSLALIGSALAINVGSCTCQYTACDQYCGANKAIGNDDCQNNAIPKCEADTESTKCAARTGCPIAYFPNVCDCCIPQGYTCDADSECCSIQITQQCSNLHCCPSGKCWNSATSSCGSCTANACTTYGDSTFGDNYCVEKTPSTPNCCGSAGSGVCKACCDNADCAGTICKKCSASYTCVNADADTDPNNNCSVGTWSCVGGTSPNVCVRQRNSGYCSGSGSCASNDEKIPVGGNYVCAGSGDNSFVPVTTSKFCDTTTYNSCGAGGCSGTATTYYHGCTINGCNNITGTCTCTTGEQGPTTTATINAGEDKVFTAGCGNQNATSQALACDVDTNYFCTAGTCSGYYRYSECNGAGTCNANANSYYQQYNVNANAGSSLTATCGAAGTTPCDAVFRPSSGAGNNKYNDGGSKYCQGFCDGSGNCDYAGNCVNYVCGDGTINSPETCEYPNTNNNVNCAQSTSQCVGTQIQTRDGFGNCNTECTCDNDAWGALSCVVGSCGAECTPGSCKSGFVCDASCKWQATSESIAAGNCNDAADNDCDSECDYDSPSCGHGDAGCPVGVTAMSNLPASICPGQNFQVNCTSSVSGVNSISARIDGQGACSFNSWSGSKAMFTCTTPATTGTYTVRCYVDSTKSYVTSPDLTRQLIVGGTPCCSGYPDPDHCDPDPACDWCPQCSGTLYSGGANRCVTAGTCSSYCDRNPADLTVPYDYCNAVCDNTDAPCALQTRCTGTFYETNTGTCTAACACNYAGWVRSTCTDSKTNCNAACSTGETKACTTAGGYPGSQLCNETTCTFGLCTSLLTCGDNITTSPPEDCDPTGTCQPPGTLGTYCNTTCKWQASPIENTFVNGCNDSVDNDCDGVRDGQDNACPEGAGINVASPYRACTDGLSQDGPPCSPANNLCTLGAAYADSDDFKCGDLCTGTNATTGQVLKYDNETSPFNKNYFNQPIGVNFTDWEAYNGLRKMFCCGDDTGEWYKNSTMNLNPWDDSFNRHACCNASSHCIDANGNCQLGLEENFELCLDGLDNDCDGKIDIEDTRCGGNVAGFVFNDAGSPVPGASVKSSPPGLGSSFENSTITNATGQYMFRALVGNYTFIAKKEGYDDNAILVNVSPDGVKANFTLRNGSCHADCTDYYGNCNPDCEGLVFVNSSGQLETCTFISDLCYDRPKDFRATYKNAATNITTEYACCKGPERTYKTLKATVTGNMTDLYDYVVNVKFMGRQAKLHILTWNSEK